MNWHYAIGNEQKGPVSEAEIENLLKDGTINAKTLVWREGMAEWQPYGALGLKAPSPILVMAPIHATCADCGKEFAPDELVPIGGRGICAQCKPLALQRLREGVVKTDFTAEVIRNQHLNHEASIKSVGSLYLLGSLFVCIAGLVIFFAPNSNERLEGIIFVPLGILQLWTGLGLRKLKSGARIPAGILSGLGLLAIPIGTIINGYILYLLFSAKGKMVFSEEYKEIIAATPHIKYRTSILVWIVLGLAVLLIALAIGGSFMTRVRPLP